MIKILFRVLLNRLNGHLEQSGLLPEKKKVREKSRECHNHKPQPFPDPKRKRKPTNPNKKPVWIQEDRGTIDMTFTA